MNNNNHMGEWVRSSSTPKRSERLKTHEEFEASELKKMLDKGWEIKSAKVKHRRPRIEKESKKPFKLFGTLECKFEIPIEILIKAGFAK